MRRRRPEPSDDAFLTVQEYAAIFRVHVQTVYSAIRSHRFKYPVIRPTGRSIRIAVPRENLPNIPALTNAE